MKRLARLLGLVGGAVAIIWAMRDRFVSIAAPREPQPPTFRVVTEPAGAPAAPSDGDAPDDLTEINGVGPVFARRLTDAGIKTFAALASAGVPAVSEAAGVPESRAADWVDQAAARS